MPEIKQCSVYASSILPASVGEVWNVVGPFDGIPSWLPVEECVLAEGTGPATKCAKSWEGGTYTWEELVDYSDEAHTMTYALLPHSEDRPQNLPLPALPTEYKATITLRPVTEGSKGTFIDYSSSFNAESTKAHETEAIVDHIFNESFGKLRQRFS